MNRGLSYLLSSKIFLGELSIEELSVGEKSVGEIFAGELSGYHKFSGKAQFSHSFGRIARNYAETVPFHKISTPGNQVKLRYFLQWKPWNENIAIIIIFTLIQISIKIFSCFFHIIGWNTLQKMKFFIKDFFSKYDQIRRKLRIWLHLLKKSLMENLICAVKLWSLQLRPRQYTWQGHLV